MTHFQIKRTVVIAGLLALALAAGCATTPGKPTAGVAVAATPAEFRLEYKCAATLKDARDLAEAGSINCDLGSRPDGLKKEPLYFSKHPLFGEIGLGDGKNKTFNFVMDETGGTGAGYDVLYFDVNNNGDLSDDAPVRAEKNEDMWQASFSPIDVTVEVGGKSYPYRFGVEFYRFNPCVFVRSLGRCEGEIKLGDETHRFALYDMNCNARYVDPMKPHEGFGRSGTIYLSGDKMALDPLAKNNKAVAQGAVLALADKCYELAYSDNGRMVSVREMAGPCGRVLPKTAEGASYDLQLLGDKGVVQLRNVEQAKVPAGEYRLVSCEVSTPKQEKKTTWAVNGTGQWKQKPIVVGRGRDAAFVFGPPLLAKVMGAPAQGAYAFNLKMRGMAGEEYGGYNAVMKNGQSQNPKVRILDATGKKIEEGQFEYG